MKARTLGKWIAWPFVQVALIPWSRAIEFVGVLRRPSVYMLVFSIIGGCVAVYKIVENKHERQLNRALFRYQALLSMVSSNNKQMFITAMKDFGPIQTMTARGEPELLDPRTWLPSNEFKPNQEPLYRWAVNYLGKCKPETCGIIGDERRRAYRIDLSGVNLEWADLHEAKLNGANLRRAKLNGPSLIGAHLLRDKLDKAILLDADLRNAEMNKADLSGAELRQADLRGANLIGANLSEANLERANLSEADLRKANLFNANLRTANLCGAKGLTKKHIESVKTDVHTKLPNDARCPKSKK